MKYSSKSTKRSSKLQIFPDGVCVLSHYVMLVTLLFSIGFIILSISTCIEYFFASSATDVSVDLGKHDYLKIDFDMKLEGM